MDVRELLEQVKSGSAEVEDAWMQLKNLPYEDLGHAKLGHHRKLRSGFGETVFCQDEPDAYLLEIYKKLYERDGKVLGTRVSESQAELARTTVPEMVYDPISRILKAEKPGKEHRGRVAICTGDTVDMPVVEKIVQAVECFGYNADRVFDTGVAGIHRLLTQRERPGRIDYIVVVAGMEGALGTVITGLVGCPMMIIPTSVGYDASFHGLSALLTTLNSCANGISVANIDDGYGAGYLAVRVNKMVVR